MADKPSKPGDPMKDLRGLIWILLGLLFLWYMSGGYERSKENTNSPYLNMDNSSLIS